MAMFSRVFSSFFATSFIVSGFMWMSLDLIHLDLSLVQGYKNGSIGLSSLFFVGSLCGFGISEIVAS